MFGTVGPRHLEFLGSPRLPQEDKRTKQIDIMNIEVKAFNDRIQTARLQEDQPLVEILIKCRDALYHIREELRNNIGST